VEDHDDKIGELQAEITDLKAQLQAAHGLNQRLSDSNGKYVSEARAKTMKSLDLMYHEVSGKFPILWVSGGNSAALDHGTFAQMRDRLKRIAPGIELIVFTQGNIKLYELSDEDLEKIGLVRIRGLISNTNTPKQLTHIPSLVQLQAEEDADD
ncbi:MAG: hypothetical protein ACREGB_01460, partial [Candidatus Saccharimonadales bacterium]